MITYVAVGFTRVGVSILARDRSNREGGIHHVSGQTISYLQRIGRQRCKSTMETCERNDLLSDEER